MSDNPQPPTTQNGAMSKRDLCTALELALFGDDLTAKTEEQIKDALRSFDLGEFRHAAEKELWKNSGGDISDERVVFWAWKLCHGQPWQSAIEAHVAAYRREPRDLTTWEGMGMVLAEMTKRGWLLMTVNFGRDVNEHAIRFIKRDRTNTTHTFPFKGDYSDMPEVVANAAHAALESEAANA